MCGLADDITNTCVRNDELSIALSNDVSLEDDSFKIIIDKLFVFKA